MDELRVDVEEVKSKDIYGTRVSSLETKFDRTNGPLWFTKFVDMNDSEQNSSSSAKNSDGKFKFTCIFGFLHILTDGTTNVKFCDVFLKVMNELVLGNDVDMKVESEFVEPFDDRLAIYNQSRSFIRTHLFYMNETLKKVYRCFLSCGKGMWNFTRYYPQPSKTPAATGNVDLELDAETTHRLLLKCRQEKVTLNSAFSAAANIAFYKLTVQRNSKCNTTKYRHYQIINMRRYWPKEQVDDSCGCHMSCLESGVHVQKSDIKNFWVFARKVHSNLESQLNNTKRALKILPHSVEMRQMYFFNSILELLKLPSFNDSHFCVTNVGNLDKSFTGEGKAVNVTKVLRQSSGHYLPFLGQFSLQTFRGKLAFSIDYYTQKMTRETAVAVMKSLHETFQDIARLPA